MNELPRADDLLWEGHLPLPTTNLILYRELFELEQWLRRISLAALLVTHGSGWLTALPPDIHARTRQALAQMKRRVYLDCERSDNAVWALTFDDFRRLLVSDELWPAVRQLTEASRQQLGTRLDELREIRNLVAHHRAASQRTLIIFRDAAATIRDAIDQFRYMLDIAYARPDRQTTLYRTSSPSWPDADDFVASALRRQQKPPSVLCEQSDLFYKITSLGSGGYCRADLLLDALAPVRAMVLAVFLGESAEAEDPTELSLFWPRKLSSNEHLHVIDAFAEFLAEHPMDAVPYRSQPAQFICDPLIWFERTQ